MKRFTSVFILSVISLQSVFAQKEDQTIPARHHSASIEILRALGAVRENVRMKNDIEAYRYKRLFSPEALVVNEVLPSNDINKQISLDQFVDYMMTYDMGGTMNTYEFRPYNLKLLEELEDSSMVFELDVIKEFGQLSAENLFYRSKLDLNFVIVIDKSLEKVLIREIKLNKPKGKFLRVDLTEKLATDKSFNRIIIVNGDSAKIEEGKTIMLGDVDENQNLKIESTSEEYIGSFNTFISKGSIGPNGRLSDDIVTVRFRPKKFYLGVEYEFGDFTDIFEIPENNGRINEVSGGLDISDIRVLFGYRFFNSNDRFFLSLDLRGGARNFSGSYSSLGHRSSYSAEDLDGDNYTHFTDLHTISESVLADVIYAGLGLNLRYKLWRFISMGASASYNIGLLQSGSYDFQAEAASYWGTYNQYGGLSLYNIEEYGFTSGEALNAIDSEILMTDNPSWLQAGLSIDFRFTKKLSFEVKTNYNIGQTIFETEIADILSSEVDKVDNSMLNIAEGHSWSFLTYVLSLRYYL